MPGIFQIGQFQDCREIVVYIFECLKQQWIVGITVLLVACKIMILRSKLSYYVIALVTSQIMLVSMIYKQIQTENGRM